MRIVLVGYMGSGKSTIGKILAKSLKINFLDLDDYIENELENTISDIFKEKGEIFFRNKEHIFLKEVLNKKNNFILSTGGGTPCYSGNMETILKETEHVFYLKVSVAGLVERLCKEKNERPLIKNLPDEDLPEFIGKHLFERNHFYSQANYTVLCDGKSPEEISEEIEKLLV
ncbi:shikimate kinase [Saonia flava]|uniref:Shikimate kinase n=1 Tax=Saonia flava TaxID=523696 RepID=A0A846QR03_9FLAO|nr:shikimate kinase [Saonia flava]NJB70581.1 shikimate kinase [Saonia flava]